MADRSRAAPDRSRAELLRGHGRPAAARRWTAGVVVASELPRSRRAVAGTSPAARRGTRRRQLAAGGITRFDSQVRLHELQNNSKSDALQLQTLVLLRPSQVVHLPSTGHQEKILTWQLMAVKDGYLLGAEIITFLVTNPKKTHTINKKI